MQETCERVVAARAERNSPGALVTVRPGVSQDYAMLNDADVIHAQMDVVSADGKYLGAVDAVLTCDLKLARGGGCDVPHLVPLAFIQRVDDKVRLVVTEGEARRTWRETY